jgi:hypothetical protein
MFPRPPKTEPTVGGAARLSQGPGLIQGVEHGGLEECYAMLTPWLTEEAEEEDGA